MLKKFGMLILAITLVIGMISACRPVQELPEFVPFEYEGDFTYYNMWSGAELAQDADGFISIVAATNVAFKILFEDIGYTYNMDDTLVVTYEVDIKTPEAVLTLKDSASNDIAGDSGWEIGEHRVYPLGNSTYSNYDGPIVAGTYDEKTKTGTFEVINRYIGTSSAQLAFQHNYWFESPEDGSRIAEKSEYKVKFVKIENKVSEEPEEIEYPNDILMNATTKAITQKNFDGFLSVAGAATLDGVTATLRKDANNDGILKIAFPTLVKVGTNSGDGAAVDINKDYDYIEVKYILEDVTNTAASPNTNKAKVQYRLYNDREPYGFSGGGWADLGSQGTTAQTLKIQTWGSDGQDGFAIKLNGGDFSNGDSFRIKIEEIVYTKGDRWDVNFYSPEINYSYSVKVLDGHTLGDWKPENLKNIPWTFCGWSTKWVYQGDKADSDFEIDDDYEFNANTTLYATWLTYPLAPVTIDSNSSPVLSIGTSYEGGYTGNLIYTAVAGDIVELGGDVGDKWLVFAGPGLSHPTYAPIAMNASNPTVFFTIPVGNNYDPGIKYFTTITVNYDLVKIGTDGIKMEVQPRAGTNSWGAETLGGGIDLAAGTGKEFKIANGPAVAAGGFTLNINAWDGATNVGIFLVKINSITFSVE